MTSAPSDQLERQHERFFRLAFYLLVLALLIFTGFIFQDFGISADEVLRNRYGKAVLSYYLTGDLKPLTMGPASYYGGLFDTVAAIIVPYIPVFEFDARHLLGGLTGVLGIIGAYRLATFLSGPVAGFFAALLLALVPGFSGAMFFNPKDVPFAVGYIWTLYFFLKAIRSYPSARMIDSLAFGFALGCTLAVKVVGAMLVLPVGAGLLLLVMPAGSNTPLLRERITALTRYVLTFMLPAACLAFAIMLVFWPWAQLSPFLNPIKALTVFSDYPHWQKEVLLFGERYPWNKIPKLYVPGYLLVQLPELVLIALAGSLALGLSALRKSEHRLERSAPFIVLLIAAFVPPLLAAIKGSTLYSGYRHFLFIVPILCVFAGLFLARLWYCAARSRMTRIALLAGLALLTIYYVVQFARLHPYQYAYFNVIVGGLPGANGRFETDYWGISYREAVRMLRKRVREETPAGETPPLTRIAVCGSRPPAVQFFPRHFRLSGVDRSNFIIAPAYGKCEELTDEKIASVGRLGAELTVIRKHTPATKQKAATQGEEVDEPAEDSVE